MSTVLDRISVSRSCLRCLSPVDDIHNLRCRETHEVTEKKEERSYEREKHKEAAVQNARKTRRVHRMLVKCGEHTLKRLSLSRWKSFLKRCEMVPSNMSLISIFTFEPLYNLHLVIFKFVKERTIGYLSSDRSRSNPDMAQSRRRPLCSLQILYCEHAIRYLQRLESGTA